MKQHTPVLLEEVLTVLDPKPGETYIDLTAGFGGHAAAILECIGDNGQALLFDQDRAAIQALEDKFANDKNVVISHTNFADIDWSVLPPADMILMDLGVSSVQIDQAERGFSFQADGPLDMRMNSSTGQTAADIVNTYGEAQLADIIYRYGEERRSRAIARKIVAVRATSPFRSTTQLADVIRSVVPGGRIDGATRTFQALRIAVNDELRSLDETLPKATEHLKAGGRLAVISFHSLEDRIVKHFMRDKTTPVWDTITGQPLQESNFRLYESVATSGRVSKKPLTASDQEIAYNPRARSAKLRAVEKKN